MGNRKRRAPGRGRARPVSYHRQDGRGPVLQSLLMDRESNREPNREIDWEPLVVAAAAARANSYSPYSHFAVGAALLMEDGSIHAAANVENCIPALSVCAERNAVSAAASAGLRRPQALVVVTDSKPPARPCGLCRQTLVEFVPDLPILVVNANGERDETRLAVLLPQPFSLPG
jgi:cytidine deaminase